MATSLDLRATVLALIALTQLNVAEVARRAQVHRPNLMGWLGGKERIFSEKNQRAVAEVLGWRSGRLRSDCVHQWRLVENSHALTTVLGSLRATAANLVTVVVPTIGADVDGGAILVLLEGPRPVLEDAAVILVARDRGLPPVATLIEAQPGLVVCRPHRVTAMEYWHWWGAHGDQTDPSDYWAAFGKSVGADIQGLTDQVAGQDLQIDLNESVQWLDMLATAAQSGLCFDDIVKRTRLALGLHDPTEMQ